MERQISKQKILVGDDMSVSTKILAEALEQIYEVTIVDEKEKVLTIARSERSSGSYPFGHPVTKGRWIRDL